MALDSTAREANARDSFKKYMIDNLNKIEGEPLTFDRGLTIPKIQGTEVEKWISVMFGQFTSDTISTYQVNITCASRKDPEGYRLIQLRDRVVGYLYASDGGPARVTLYKSNATPWLSIGSMLVYVDTESGQMEADDNTKFKVIPIRLRWGAKI
jgi:hypothetical protein